jgi:hypothetical protein
MPGWKRPGFFIVEDFRLLPGRSVCKKAICNGRYASGVPATEAVDIR